MRIDVRSLRDLDDEVLVDRSRGRDRAAFEELVRRYADRLYAVVLRLCTDAHEAEEVTQEAFLRAWRGIGSAGTEATSICSCRRSSSRGTSSSPTTREAPGAAMRWPTARWSGRGAIRSVESARPSRRRRGAGVLRPGVRAGLSGGLLVVLGGGTVQLLDRSPAAPGRRRVSCPTSSIAASSSARSASERSPCARRSCHDVALTARTEGAARSAQRSTLACGPAREARSRCKQRHRERPAQQPRHQMVGRGGFIEPSTRGAGARIRRVAGRPGG